MGQMIPGEGELRRERSPRQAQEERGSSTYREER